MMNKLQILFSNLKDNLIYRSKNVFNNLIDLVDKTYKLLWKLSKVAILLVVFSVSIMKLYEMKHQADTKHWYKNSSLLDKKYEGPSHEPTSDYHRPVVRIVAKDSAGEIISICSAVVISNYYALTAGHCLVDRGDLVKETYIVYNDEGKEITTAKAAFYEDRPDLGLLRGDFTKFNQVPVLNKGSFFEGVTQSLRACGYPHGSKEMFCDIYKYDHISGFSIAGVSVFIPGMSGGAVYDEVTGNLVGIIASSEEASVNANASLLIGFDAVFEIEP